MFVRQVERYYKFSYTYWSVAGMFPCLFLDQSFCLSLENYVCYHRKDILKRDLCTFSSREIFFPEKYIKVTGLAVKMQFVPVWVGFLLFKVTDAPRAATAAVTLASLCPWWAFTPHVKGFIKYDFSLCRTSIYKRKGGSYFPYSFLCSCNCA